MPQVKETPPEFKPETTITIQVAAELDTKSRDAAGAFCTIEGEVTDAQWCNIFHGFGDMVANIFTEEFEEYLRKSNKHLSDKEKSKAYQVYQQKHLLHMISHLQGAFEDVGKSYLKGLGKPKDMQA